MDRGSPVGVEPTAEDEGLRKIRTGGDVNSIFKADGGAMLPEEMSSAPGEGLSAGLGISQVGKSTVGCDSGQ